MISFPLSVSTGRLFVELEGLLWLFASGTVTSFGKVKSLTICGEQFRLSPDYLGLTVETFSRQIGVECAGLLGADILGRLDHILDVPGGKIIVSAGELPLFGERHHVEDFMGMPIVIASIDGRECRMLFDTGAQISYLPEELLARFPSMGGVTDVYPGYGPFQTNTHGVPVTLGKLTCVIRFGCLPGVLGSILEMGQTQGILGNQLSLDRVMGYFPRRGALCFNLK